MSTPKDKPRYHPPKPTQENLLVHWTSLQSMDERLPKRRVLTRKCTIMSSSSMHDGVPIVVQMKPLPLTSPSLYTLIPPRPHPCAIRGRIAHKCSSEGPMTLQLL